MIFQKDKPSMEHLLKANDAFRKKDYHQSLQYYNKALGIPQNKVDEIPSIKEGINIIVLSLRGLNYYSLRDYERAEKDFDAVLRVKPFDTTTLHRRATLFLKTKSYEKAARDIVKLYQLEPENIRVSALVMEIKQKSQISWKQELRKLHDLQILQDQIESEQEQLNFVNLKKLDRQIPKRVSIKNHPVKPRTSVVEFKQDSLITYEATESEATNPVPQLSANMMKNILDNQKKELQSTGKQNLDSNIVIVQKGQKKKHKSILKCSIMHKLPEDQKSSNASIQPIDVTKVLDIDGKPVKKSYEIKFVSAQLKSDNKQQFDVSKLKNKVKRKSSMKQTSFNLPEMQSQSSNNHNQAHRSSFLSLKNTDGKIIKKNQKMVKRQKESSDSDSGQQHNIFGDYAIQNIEKQIQNVFGCSSSGKQGNSTSVKVPKKSILKIMQPIGKQDQIVSQKPKKSVLFR